jgi:hypothetical protein
VTTEELSELADLLWKGSVPDTNDPNHEKGWSHNEAVLEAYRRGAMYGKEQKGKR